MSALPQTPNGQKSILQYFQRDASETRDESVVKEVKLMETSEAPKKCSSQERRSGSQEIISLSDDEEECMVVEEVSNSSYGDINVASCSLTDSCEREFLDVSAFMEMTLSFKEADGAEAAQDTAALEDDFKLSKFMEMVDNVLYDPMHKDLFNDDDWRIIESFTCLSGPAQRLLVRLYLRKHQWIRLSQINYPEIDDDLKPFLKELCYHKFLHSVVDLISLKSALSLLESSEVKQCAKDLKGVKFNGGGTKESFINAVMKHVKSSRTIQSHFGTQANSTVALAVLGRIKKIIKDTAYCVNVEVYRLFERMRLLYYPPTLNEDEPGAAFSYELFTLLRVENNVIKYPAFRLNKKTQIFKNRNDLIQYEESCQLEREILSATEKRDFKTIIETHLPKAKEFHKKVVTRESTSTIRSLPTFLRCYAAGYVLIRCISHCAGVLEQRGLREEAIKIYKLLLSQHVFCQHYRGRWYERLALNLEAHLKQPQNAFEVIQKALKDSEVREGHRYSIYLRGKKLENSAKKKIPEIQEYCFKLESTKIESPVLRKQFGPRKNIFVSVEENGDCNVLAVEQVVIQHYKDNGYLFGIHTEGLVYIAIFSLLLWDVLYLDNDLVSDVFRSELQTIPLDLNSDDFFIRRREIINQRLRSLRSSTVDVVCDQLVNTWNENEGCTCLINWEKLEVNQLKEIVECMGVMPVVDICERLAKDFRHTRSGFPDLLMWNVHKKLVKAIEVKGPGDKLSPKQALWLNYLQTIGVPAEVCYVKADKP